MKGRFILRTDRGANEFGEYPICLQYSKNKVGVKKATGLFIHPDFWLGDNGRSTQFILGGKDGHPQAEHYNNVLLKKKMDVDQFISELERKEGFEMTVPILRSILNGTYKKELDSKNGKLPFVEEVLRYNRSLYHNGKISYSVWHNVECNMNNFKKFLQQEKKLDINSTNILLCKDITVQLIEDYIGWRKLRGNRNDTINKCLTPIFKTIKRLMRLGCLKREIGDEILEMYLPTQCVSLDDNNIGKVDYLTEEQVKQLIQLTAESKYDRTKDLMDQFLFSIHCGGMRYSDICTLRWMEIDYDQMFIRHLQVKNHTKKPVILMLPISMECLNILKRWEDRFDNFVFGQLPDEFDLLDVERLKVHINSRNKTMNQSLQCMGEKMELPFRLHFHIARHTFASLALNRGVDLKTISYLLGHSSTLVTEKVYAKLFPETLQNTVNDKLNFDFT